MRLNRIAAAALAGVFTLASTGEAAAPRRRDGNPEQRTNAAQRSNLVLLDISTENCSQTLATFLDRRSGTAIQFGKASLKEEITNVLNDRRLSRMERALTATTLETTLKEVEHRSMLAVGCLAPVAPKQRRT